MLEVVLLVLLMLLLFCEWFVVCSNDGMDSRTSSNSFTGEILAEEVERNTHLVL